MMGIRSFMWEHPALALAFIVAVLPLTFGATFFLTMPGQTAKRVGFILVWVLIAMLGLVIILDWNNGNALLHPG
jgi:hypothetical protein